jgi:RluA family pseudouridine synthase
LYEDRSVIAVDKPRGWMLLPVSWQNTGRNLQTAINSSITARDFWARSHGIKFLRYVHRLDADTSGVLLFVKSPGAVEMFSGLFESRKMEKTYLAVVDGKLREAEWTCRLKLAPDPQRVGRMKVDVRNGKEAETHFRVLQNKEQLTLVEARPFTGRTHQIRVHLAEAGCPVVGDELYGREDHKKALGLRAVRLAYADPFTRRRVDIQAPTEEFLREYGFDLPPV